MVAGESYWYYSGGWVVGWLGLFGSHTSRNSHSGGGAELPFVGEQGTLEIAGFQCSQYMVALLLLDRA